MAVEKYVLLLKIFSCALNVHELLFRHTYLQNVPPLWTATDRGQLGIPTANIPISGLSVGGHNDLQSGAYFGWAGVSIDDQGRQIDAGVETTDVGSKKQRGGVWPMVMSIGWNPFYKNTMRSVVRITNLLLFSLLLRYEVIGRPDHLLQNKFSSCVLRACLNFQRNAPFPASWPYEIQFLTSPLFHRKCTSFPLNHLSTTSMGRI